MWLSEGYFETVTEMPHIITIEMRLLKSALTIITSFAFKQILNIHIILRKNCKMAKSTNLTSRPSA